MSFFNHLSLFFLLLMVLFISVGKAAESVDDATTIRVGLINVKNDEQEVRNIYHKYSRAYLTEISKNTNWSYEYKTGTLEECRELLLKGEVDLIGPVQYEADDDMIFSAGHACYGIFSIYCHRSDERITAGRAEDVKGTRIGIVENAEAEYYLSFSIEDNNWDIAIQKFTNYAEMLSAFNRGDIELIVDDGSHVTNEELRLTPIGQVTEQFLTTKEHSLLMEKLNKAMLTNEIRYPFFLNRLQGKYLYPVLQLMSPYLEAEKNFIEHAPTLKAAFLPAQLPLYDSAASKGIYIDYLKMMADESGLNFELIEGSSEQELGEMLWSGKADIAFVVYSDGNYNSTVSFTNEIDQALFVAVTSREMKQLPETAKVALVHTFTGVQSYLKQQYENWTQQFYNNIEDCLQAVENQECDIAFVPALMLQRENSMVTHPSLTTYDKNNFQLSICLAISHHQPYILQRVLNTAILHLNQKQMDMIVHKNEEPVISINYVLATYPLPIVMAVCIVMGTVVFSGAFYMRERTRRKQNKILREKNMELETALRAVENMRIDRDNYRAESERDKLTQLYNKDTTKKICNEQLGNLTADKTAVLYIIDLDHFKEANDTFGHQYGDRILVEFAVQLRHIFRVNDCVGRFGGDEFIVMIIGKINDEVIFRKARQIKQVATQLDIEGKVVGVTASIGIAKAANKGQDYETLFKQADKALYCVKENGRDGYCLEPPNVIH